MHRTISLTRVLSLVLVGMLLPILGGCASDKQVISQAAEVHQGLQPAVITDPQLARYIQQIGDRVIASARQLYQQGYGPAAKDKSDDSSWMFSNAMQFHLVASDTLNAFTTGGEHMYIYSQLLQTCKNEDELAAVVAHEYAHVYSRHVAKGMNRQYAVLGAAGAAGALGYAAGSKEDRMGSAATFASAAAAAGSFIGLTYTRGDEAQADEVGYQFYVHAGWDPNRFAGFFKTLIDKGMDTSSALTSDHPTLASRVENVNKWTAQLPPQAAQWRQPDTANDAQFKALQARTTQVVASMPKDETINKAKLLLAAFPSCVTPEDQPKQKAAQQQIAALLQQKQPQK
jgi:predicted Zn-dependent protease